MDKRIGTITPPLPTPPAVSSASVDAPAPTRVKRQPSPMREDIANRLDRLELQSTGGSRLSGSSFRQPTVAKGETSTLLAPVTVAMHSLVEWPLVETGDGGCGTTREPVQ